MIARLLHRITGSLPCRIISDGDQPYLERYYVGTLFGWRFYLHRFVESDPDRGLHDHPWRRAYSLILSGWYWEESRNHYRVRQVRWFNSLTGDTFHRVVLPRGEVTDGRGSRTRTARPCWTLFWHSTPDTKPWGFLRTDVRTQAFAADPDAALFVPYRYQHEGNEKPEQWWKAAPLGRNESRRYPA